MKDCFLDKNIITEILFDRPKAYICEKIISDKNYKKYMSNFSLYSLYILLERKKEDSKINTTILYLLENNIEFCETSLVDGFSLFQYKKEWNLDVDDALQLYIAKTMNIPFITFDSDFDVLKNSHFIYSPEEFLLQ